MKNMLCNICPFIPSPICTSVSPTSIRTPIYPSIHPPAPSICPSTHISIYPSIRPSIHPSMLLASEHCLALNVSTVVPSQGHCYQWDVALWKLSGLSFISPKASPRHLFFLLPGIWAVFQQQYHSICTEGKSRLSHQSEVQGKRPELRLRNAIYQ